MEIDQNESHLGVTKYFVKDFVAPIVRYQAFCHVFTGSQVWSMMQFVNLSSPGVRCAHSRTISVFGFSFTHDLLLEA